MNTDQPTSDAPIACTLEGSNAFEERADAWRAVARAARHRDAQPGRITTSYPRRPELAEQLARLIEAEQACCPFLEFDVREVADAIEVELRYPPEAAPLLEAVLGPSVA